MKQITFTLRNHQLANTDAWTPNSQWLVSDMHPSGAPFAGETIKRVNIRTGELEMIYRIVQGLHVGAVTIYPKLEKYVFIHGSENPDKTWHYDFYHRRRVIITQAGVESLGAVDIAALYALNALRGGSHVHVFNPSGELISFTHDGHVLHKRFPAFDLHDVGVAAPYGPAKVFAQHPREYSGGHWCVLVSQTTPTPRPDSSEVNRTYKRGWVGENRLAFIDDTLSATGEKMPELFIVGLPQDEGGWKQLGGMSLEGIDTTVPVPLSDTRQHRLTFTRERAFPGLVNQPHHWVRSDPEASEIVFLMHDDSGIVQLWLTSPQGGSLRQLT